MSLLDTIGSAAKQGFGALKGIWDDYTGKSINQQNIQAVKENNQLARQWALSDFDMTNRYNSPVQQMQRLREAGLNPNLVYGSGANMTAAMVRNSNPEPSKSNPLTMPNIPDVLTGALGSIVNLKQANAQIDNVRAATDLTRQHLINAKIAAAGGTTANESKLLHLDIDRALKDTTISSGIERLRNLRLYGGLTSQKTAESVANTYLKQFDLKNVRPELINLFKERIKYLTNQNQLLEFENKLRDWNISPTTNAGFNSVLNLLKAFILKK